MISVAAIRMQQFGVHFYQASLTASDIDKLVRFEVLSYGEQAQPVRGGRKKAPPVAAPSKVNWDLLERRIASSEKAYQRQIIRRKIDELVQYYEQCRQARDLPSIPGAVIISCDETLRFEPAESGSSVGTLKVPEREGILRAIDGQHRLLALHADIERFGDEQFTVPAVIFDRLPEDHVVQMFVTINAKHTRLNASHLVSLSGRQLYRDESLAAAHDIVRALNDREDSPLYGEIKLLGVGSGRVAQAPLAQELKKLFAAESFGTGKKGEDFRDESKKFFVNYLKQVAQVVKKFFRNARAVFGSGLDALPVFCSGPLAIEESGFAVRSAEQPEGSGAYCEHGPEGMIHLVGNTRRFIDHHETDGREAANRAFAFGQTDDARAIGEHQRAFVGSIAADAIAELRGGFLGLP